MCARNCWSPSAVAAVACLESAGSFDPAWGVARWTPERTGLGPFPLPEAVLLQLGVPRDNRPFAPMRWTVQGPPGQPERWGVPGRGFASWTWGRTPVEDQLPVVERYLRRAFDGRPPQRPRDYRLALLGAAPRLPGLTRLELPSRRATVAELGRELETLMSAAGDNGGSFELGAEGGEVPRKRTPASSSDVAPLLEAALRDRGEKPNRAGAALLHSQLWLETGRGTAMQNNNPGNITAGSRWEGDYWRPPWFEPPPYDETKLKGFGGSPARLERLHEQMLAGKAPSKFRSYDTLAAGMADYVRLIVSTFRGVYDAAQRNDPAAMARQINLTGYCPKSDCPPNEVAESLASIQRDLLGRGLYRDLPEGPPQAVGNASAGKLLFGAAVLGTGVFLFTRTVHAPRKAAG